MRTFTTVDEARAAAKGEQGIACVIEIDHATEGRRFIMCKAPLRVLAHAIKQKPMPELVRLVAEHPLRTVEQIRAEVAARQAKLEAACPGITELQAAVEAEEAYDDAFARMMDSEANDGARPPRRPTISAEALKAQYPRAALYLRAEGYEQASHDAKASAGVKAKAMLLAGESEQAVAQVLESWLPASAYYD